MNKNIIVFLMAFISLAASAQQELLGTWIQTGVETVNGDYSRLAALREKTYLKYTFLNDGVVYIGNSPDAYGTEDNYVVEHGGFIIFHYFTMKIDLLTANEMVLIELDGGVMHPNATRIHFLREEEYLRQQSLDENDYLVKENDTIYNSSKNTYVTFKDKTTDFWNYARTKLEGYTKEKEYAFSLATFVVNPDATVEQIQIWHHVNKKFDNQLVKLIEQSSKNWITHPVNGKDIKVKKQFYLKRNHVTKVRIAQNFVMTTVESKNNPMDYFEQFAYAVQLMERLEWTEAINVLLNCVGLSDDPLNVYYQLSVCYDHMNNPELKQFYLDQLKKTKLEYLIVAQITSENK